MISTVPSKGDKVAALVSSIVSAAAPAYELIAGILELDWHPSIYQPGIYGDVPRFFLVLPFVVGLYAGWRAVIRGGAITAIFLVCLAITIIVASIYYLLPSESPFHQANWILSYIVVSLICSLVIGVLWSLFRSP